jgi:hypothetical protein
MPAAHRLLIAFALLIGAFLVLVALAVWGLLDVRQYGLAALVAGAGLAGTIAGAVTYWLLRQDEEEAVEVELLVRSEEPAWPAQPARPSVEQQSIAHLSSLRTGPARIATARPALLQTRTVRHTPLRVQTMPVADLPPAYVDAVLKGAQARLSALKAEAKQTIAR